jgi:hypothetical protein
MNNNNNNNKTPPMPLQDMAAFITKVSEHLSQTQQHVLEICHLQLTSIFGKSNFSVATTTLDEATVDSSVTASATAQSSSSTLSSSSRRFVLFCFQYKPIVLYQNCNYEDNMLPLPTKLAYCGMDQHHLPVVVVVVVVL